MNSDDENEQEQLADLIRKAVRPSHSGDFPESYRRLDELQRRFPTSVEPLRWKGNLLDLEALEEKSGLNEDDTSNDPRLDEARRCYEAILSLNPKDTIALIDLGEDHERRGDLEGAVALCDQALALLGDGHFVKDLDDELEAAYVLKIRCLKELGRAEETERVRRQALGRLPSSRELRVAK